MNFWDTNYPEITYLGINKSQEKALLEIALDCVKIIRPNEYGLTAHHISHDVGGADILPTKGDREKERANTDADIG